MNFDELLAGARVSKSLKEIETQFNWYKWRLKFALEENKRLKERNFKDEELAAMKKELDDLKAVLNRSFVITDSEWENIKEWEHTHDVEKHGLDTFDKRIKANGYSGGRYSFVFTPTSLGDIGVVKCGTCGEEYCFKELS